MMIFTLLLLRLGLKSGMFLDKCLNGFIVLGYGLVYAFKGSVEFGSGLE